MTSTEVFNTPLPKEHCNLKVIPQARQRKAEITTPQLLLTMVVVVYQKPMLEFNHIKAHISA